MVSACTSASAVVLRVRGSSWAAEPNRRAPTAGTVCRLAPGRARRLFGDCTRLRPPRRAPRWLASSCTCDFETIFLLALESVGLPRPGARVPVRSGTAADGIDARAQRSGPWRTEPAACASCAPTPRRRDRPRDCACSSSLSGVSSSKRTRRRRPRHRLRRTRQSPLPEALPPPCGFERCCDRRRAATGTRDRISLDSLSLAVAVLQ